MSESQNFFLAIFLSALVIIGWQYIFPPAQTPPTTREQAQNTLQPPAIKTIPSINRQDAIDTGSKRISIQSNTLHGSINLKGVRFDDLTLAQYRTSLDKKSPEVALLSPSATKAAHFIQFGWLSNNNNITLPDSNTMWNSNDTTLTPGKNVTLFWVNPQNIRFEYIIALDENYLFTITQKVKNQSNSTLNLLPFGLIKRYWDSSKMEFAILHEGPIATIDGKLEEYDFSDIVDDKKVQFSNTKGWLGFSDKYWLTSLIPSQASPFNVNFTYDNRSGTDRFQVDFLGQSQRIIPGDQLTTTHHMFAGAKLVSLLDRYTEELQIPLFDRAVDFGWLYFITKPMYYALQSLYRYLQSFGLAILALTVIIKALLYPLANKSYRSMAQIKELYPKVTDLRERYKDDKMQLQKAIMDLYKEHNVNPSAGCLPALLQIPIFFALYKVLFITIEMRHAPFYGWIQDLSAPDPTSIFNLFGVIDWTPPSFLMIGGWPIIMCLTMVLQQRFNPQPTDPTQARIMKMLPYIFLFLFASFPAGLVIYWAWNNVLSILQQWLIKRSITNPQPATT